VVFNIDLQKCAILPKKIQSVLIYQIVKINVLILQIIQTLDTFYLFKKNKILWLWYIFSSSFHIYIYKNKNVLHQITKKIIYTRIYLFLSQISFVRKNFNQIYILSKNFYINIIYFEEFNKFIEVC